MIIKRMDSREKEFEELRSLLRNGVSPAQRSVIERELKTIKMGSDGEEDSAYFIDFYYESSQNWAVIHDLRLELENQVAQIDHLLINRSFDFYVLESKNYAYGLKITPEGEFLVQNGNRSQGIPSPIEQNKRHIHFLDNFLKAHDILPKRMGFAIRPNFKNLILISPKSVITRPPSNTFDTGMVIKADALRTKIIDEIDQAYVLSDLKSMGKFSSSSTIEEVARKLASFHRPLKIDFRAKFVLPAPPPPAPKSSETESHGGTKPTIASNQYLCSKCRKAISEKVATFCWQNKSKFGGKCFCFDCQKAV
jgi:hypothetical protein